ncbi:MAG: hypothetical protein WC708_01800 [Lentisphaeria bacterium]
MPLWAGDDAVAGKAPGGTMRFTASPCDWVYAPGEPVLVTLARDDVSRPAELRVSAVDFWGQAACSRKEVWEKGAAVKKVSLDFDRLGYFVVTASLAVTGGKPDPFVVSQPLVVIPPAPPIPNDRNPFGANFHLTWFSDAAAEKELRLARRIGFGWGRGLLFDWVQFAAPPNLNDPKFCAQWDRFIALIEKSGIACLGAVYYVPKWASGAPDSSEFGVWSRTMPDDLTPLTNYCEAMAKRFPSVRYWEVGNESDAVLFWHGRKNSYASADDQKIIEDYVDFLAAAAKGFRRGNPAARILFSGITDAREDGADYRPFVKHAFSRGAGRYADVMNVHYVKDIPAVRRLLKATGDDSKPVWVTEIGGWTTGEDGDPRPQIIRDITQSVIQLSSGAERVFKFGIRNDVIDPAGFDYKFGLVRNDFVPQPAYVAYATLIRLMADATFKKELNVTAQASPGWLRGYEYSSPQAAFLNCLWLNEASKAAVVLQTAAPTLTLIDVMGNARELKAHDGIVRFEADALPFFIVGPISDRQGEIKYPADEFVRTIPIPLANPGFEAEPAGGFPFPGWISTFAPNCTLSRNLAPPSVHGGKASAAIHVPAPVKIAGKTTPWPPWPDIHQRLDWASLRPQLTANEYLKVRLEAWVKCTGVTGPGVCVGCFLTDKNGARVRRWVETAPRPWGNASGWERLELAGTIPVPDENGKLSVELHMAPGTCGTVEWDDLSLSIEVWRKQIK